MGDDVVAGENERCDGGGQLQEDQNTYLATWRDDLHVIRTLKLNLRGFSANQSM